MCGGSHPVFDHAFNVLSEDFLWFVLRNESETWGVASTPVLSPESTYRVLWRRQTSRVCAFPVCVRACVFRMDSPEPRGGGAVFFGERPRSVR